MKLFVVFVCACMSMAAMVAEAFVPAFGGRAGLISTNSRLSSTSPVPQNSRQNAFSQSSFSPRSVNVNASGRQPSSSVTTMGIFGLGAPEIAVCLVVAAIVLGPDKLAGVAKDVGMMAGELKDVPKEFQAGIEEGEKKATETKSAAATPVETVADAEPAEKKKKEEPKEAKEAA